MVNSMQAAIIKKDFRSIVSNKRLFPVLLVVPLIFTVFLPSVFILTISFAPDDLDQFQPLIDMMPLGKQFNSMEQAIIELIMNNIMPVFFSMIPIMAASVMAASAFVGEKEKRTLETLLYCPLPLKKIFQSKVLASFLVSMTVAFSSFIVMLIVVEIEVMLTTGSMFIPGISWIVVMLLVSPSVSLLAITLIVGGSAKSQTMEESQQRAVFLIIPLLILIVGQFTGIILINVWYLSGLGVIIAILAAVMMRRSESKYTYEELLR